MRIEINGVKWDIVYVDSSSPKLMRENGTLSLAVTDNNDKTVYINNNLSGYMLEKVISHEIVHVFSFSYQLLLDVPTEELIADFLATYGRDVINVADEILGRFKGALYG